MYVSGFLEQVQMSSINYPLIFQQALLFAFVSFLSGAVGNLFGYEFWPWVITTFSVLSIFNIVLVMAINWVFRP